MYHSRIRNRRAYLQVTLLIAPLFFSSAGYGNDTKASGIKVELNEAKPLSLRITLTSGAAKTVRFTRDKLPWSAGHNMSIVVALEGRCLNRELPVSDSMFDEISMEPNTSLTGKIDLEAIFPDIDRVLKDRDLQLFWAYEAPAELNIPRWSGGWILIPRQK